MTEKLVELLGEILDIGKQQLVSLERKRIEEICELDRKRQELIDKIREIERDRKREFHRDHLNAALFASDEDRGQIKKLVDSIISTDRELGEKIECQMNELSETMKKITKLRRVFCTATFHNPSGRKLNVSA